MTARKKPAKAQGRGKAGAKKAPANLTHRTPSRARARKGWADRALSGLRDGLSRSGACAEAGVSRPAFYEKLNTDPAFAEAVEAAEAEGAAKSERIILKAGGKDWRARAFVLERRRPEEWGKRDKVEHSGSITNKTTPPLAERITLLISDPEKAKAFFDAVDDDDDTDSA